MWGCPPLIACAALFHDQDKEKRMKASQLTTIAALPMGGGRLSSLPAEKNEAKAEMMTFEELMDDLPKIDTVDEMASKLLARVQAGQ